MKRKILIALLVLAAIPIAYVTWTLTRASSSNAAPATPKAKQEFKHELDGRHHVTNVFENGRLVRKDLYGDYGAVYVTYFDANGSPTRMQTWGTNVKQDPKGSGLVTTYHLMRTTEYHPGTKVIKRVFTMNGKSVWDSTEFDKNGKATSSRRYYNDDGTLSEEDFYDADGKVIKTVPHKPEEGIRGTVSPDAIAQPEGLREK